MSSSTQVHGSISEHMAREEAEVFPLLERHLCATQQRAMVWRTLRAMPLRLLERVMPCVTATMSAGDTQQLLANMRLGAPAHDSTLVELLTRWAEGPRGQGLQLQHCLAGGAVGGERAGMAPGLLAVGDGISTLQGNGCVGSAAGVEVESHGGSVLLPLGAGEGAAVAVEPAPKRQRLSEPCSSGQVTQSGALCGGAGQLRAVLAQGAVGVAQSRGGGVEAVLLPAGMLSRQQSTSSDLDPCNTAGGYQGVEEMCCDGGAVLGGPTAANASMEESTTCSALGAGTAALGAGGVAGTSPSTCGCPGGAAHVLERGSSPAGTGTVTGAVVRAGPSPTPSVAAAASAGKGSEGGNSDGDGSGEARSQFNPIDHIFQFHQALRQELRQLEAEALRLEAAVMDELSSAGGNGAGGGARPGSRLGPSCLSGGLSSGAEAPAAAGGPERAGAAAAASAGVAAAAAGEVEEHTAVRPFGCVTGTGTPRATASAGVPDFLRSPFGCSGTGLARTCSPAVGGSSGGGPLAAGCRLPWRVAAALQALEGRFHFMWGIYRCACMFGMKTSLLQTIRTCRLYSAESAPKKGGQVLQQPCIPGHLITSQVLLYRALLAASLSPPCPLVSHWPPHCTAGALLQSLHHKLLLHLLHFRRAHSRSQCCHISCCSSTFHLLFLLPQGPQPQQVFTHHISLHYNLERERDLTQLTAPHTPAGRTAAARTRSCSPRWRASRRCAT